MDEDYRSEEDDDYNPSEQEDEEDPRSTKRALCKDKSMPQKFLVGAAIMSDDDEEEVYNSKSSHIVQIHNLPKDHQDSIDKRNRASEVTCVSSKTMGMSDPLCDLAVEGVEEYKRKRKPQKFNMKLLRNKKTTLWGLKSVSKALWCQECRLECSPSDRWKCICGHYKTVHTGKKCSVDIGRVVQRRASTHVALRVDEVTSEKALDNQLNSSVLMSIIPATVSNAPVSCGPRSSALSAPRIEWEEDLDNPNIVKYKETAEFAGEIIEIVRVLQKGSKEEVKLRNKDQLAFLIESLESGPKKLTTLDKSKLDWDVSKINEGDAATLREFAMSKDGFRQKQKFLEDTETRVFERERAEREHQRTVIAKLEEAKQNIST